MAEQFIRIVNWAKFQHYRDRNPPWIKLHRELLTSRTWVSVDDASRVLAIACMLVASATDNKIPMDPNYLRRIAYLNSEPDFSQLFNVGFVELFEASTSASKSPADASKTLAAARPEAEAEGKKEGEEASWPETPPEGLTQIEYARKLLECLGLPFTGNVTLVADAISADAKKHGITKAKSYEFIRQQALRNQDEGVEINRFYWTDAKFRRVVAQRRSVVSGHDLLTRTMTQLEAK